MKGRRRLAAGVVLVCWVGCATAGLAQAADPSASAPPPIDPHAVQPERPTVATHAGTIAPGWIEVEFGGELDRYAGGGRGGSLPIVAKIGLAPRAQLSVVGSAVHPPDSGTTGAGDLAVGIKWRLLDDAPVLGRFAVLPSVKLPTGSVAAGSGTGTTDAGLLLISSHSFGAVSLDLNAGYTRRSGDGSAAPPSWTVWTASFGGPAAGAVGWVAEIFGLPRTAGPTGQAAIVATLFGPTLAVRRWLALDAGVIVPVSGPQPHAVYVGGVWNIGRLRR